jgi:PIN domain nuclease of toxin-antitoxin system
MILLDTNAVIWATMRHRRARSLLKSGTRLFVSPVALLELHFLVEVGRLELKEGSSLADVANDPRWEVDAPASDALFRAAFELDWTRDPFDRLLVAHARLRRWRFATGDARLLEKLGREHAIAV